MGTTSILYAELVGSHGFLQHAEGDVADTVGDAAAQLRRCRSVIEHGGGEVTKLRGDGVTAIFPSAISAVRAAMALQQATEWDRRHAQPSLDLRVGLNVGETIVDSPDVDEAIFQAAVAVARALCASADTGEIRVSDIVRILTVGRDGIAFDELGAVANAGHGDPIAAYRVRWEPLPERRPIRTVVADDVVLIRSGVARLLAEEGFDIVGEAGTFDDLIELALRTRPEFIVTDIRMPPTSTDEGLRAAVLLRAEIPALAVMVLSQHVEPTAAAALLSKDPSAIGYLLKERVSHLDEFVESCRTVASGGCVIDPNVTERLVKRSANDVALSRLSERERAVLDLLAQGRSNGAIAREIHCSAKTLESHIRSIFTKLDLAEHPDEHRRVAAVVRWLHRD
jgi:DNA-binding NarL/FixJ family response regulator/class 3 adenylate cyclase